MELDPPASSDPTATRKRKPPAEVPDTEACVREIRDFIRMGVPGMEQLGQAWRDIRDRYHPDDPVGWADSCYAAFGGYGRDIQRRLEECEWELDRLDPCELWFFY